MRIVPTDFPAMTEESPIPRDAAEELQPPIRKDSIAGHLCRQAGLLDGLFKAIDHLSDVVESVQARLPEPEPKNTDEVRSISGSQLSIALQSNNEQMERAILCIHEIANRVDLT